MPLGFVPKPTNCLGNLTIRDPEPDVGQPTDWPVANRLAALSARPLARQSRGPARRFDVR
jgi:hypothetical protein